MVIKINELRGMLPWTSKNIYILIISFFGKLDIIYNIKILSVTGFHVDSSAGGYGEEKMNIKIGILTFLLLI